MYHYRILNFNLGVFILLLNSLIGNAQDTTTVPGLKVSAYLELYYSYDFSKPSDHQRPYFLYNFARHNEVNLNLGFIRAAYSTERLRANLAVMAGNYAQYNLSTEPTALQTIYEANVGVKLSAQHKLWLDVGVMPSHIGLESALGADNWVLSRSIVAENSPYYETGVRLGYWNKNEKLFLAGYYLNGWQRISRIDGNQTPAFGTQVLIKPSKRFTLNWSTFAGNVYPDSTIRWRYYNNLYVIWQVYSKFGITGAFDLGLEQKSVGSNEYNIWWTPLLLLNYKFTPKTAMSVRGEYYLDKGEVIIPNTKGKGFNTLGYSVNVDHTPNNYLMLRLEARCFQSKDAIFTMNGKPSFMNYCLSASMAIKL